MAMDIVIDAVVHVMPIVRYSLYGHADVQPTSKAALEDVIVDGAVINVA